ncbi:MAG: hypothetical protein LVR00_04500 [Rhabdochlamydiaceae bacterium]|jgi:uncharacterized protein YoxC
MERVFSRIAAYIPSAEVRLEITTTAFNALRRCSSFQGLGCAAIALALGAVVCVIKYYRSQTHSLQEELELKKGELQAVIAKNETLEKCWKDLKSQTHSLQEELELKKGELQAVIAKNETLEKCWKDLKQTIETNQGQSLKPEELVVLRGFINHLNEGLQTLRKERVALDSLRRDVKGAPGHFVDDSQQMLLNIRDTTIQSIEYLARKRYSMLQERKDQLLSIKEYEGDAGEEIRIYKQTEIPLIEAACHELEGLGSLIDLHKGPAATFEDVQQILQLHQDLLEPYQEELAQKKEMAEFLLNLNSGGNVSIPPLSPIRKPHRANPPTPFLGEPLDSEGLGKSGQGFS